MTSGMVRCARLRRQEERKGLPFRRHALRKRRGRASRYFEYKGAEGYGGAASGEVKGIAAEGLAFPLITRVDPSGELKFRNCANEFDTARESGSAVQA